MARNRDVPLVGKEPLEGAYLLLTFRHPEVAREGRAGQFVMIKAGTSPEPLLRRPFSIMDVDARRETFTLFLKTVGPGSRALADLRPGETAACLGPLGRPFTAPSPGVEPLLVAGGYGIAPFHLFSLELVARGVRPRLFYGGRGAGDLQVRSPFATMGVPVALSTDDGTLGHHGRVTEPLEAYIDASPNAARCALYACGPEAMLHAVARVGERRGLRAQVSLDPWMGCGIGTCLGCVVPIQGAEESRPRFRCACTEGPVFDARDVVWRGEGVSLARRARQAEVGA
ncbi:MAG TPA: dihydroorotate dehydrogenase electron transfer subunit [Vicinamibacteria bacterium]|nr:dihydroorotate dehydrogenase electron transfer subunit [Vicinamibacteria bacterium]